MVGNRQGVFPSTFPRSPPCVALSCLLRLAALLALSVTGCAVSRDQSTVGQYVDDTGITARVKARFAEDATVSAVAIRVETLRGVVQFRVCPQRGRAGAGRGFGAGDAGVAGVRNDIGAAVKARTKPRKIRWLRCFVFAGGVFSVYG